MAISTSSVRLFIYGFVAAVLVILIGVLIYTSIIWNQNKNATPDDPVAYERLKVSRAWTLGLGIAFAVILIGVIIYFAVQWYRSSTRPKPILVGAPQPVSVQRIPVQTIEVQSPPQLVQPPPQTIQVQQPPQLVQQPPQLVQQPPQLVQQPPQLVQSPPQTIQVQSPPQLVQQPPQTVRVQQPPTVQYQTSTVQGQPRYSWNYSPQYQTPEGFTQQSIAAM